MQNQIFAIFTVTLIFEQLTQTLMPSFVEQRDLYESRERASRTYSWKIFVLANIVGEIPWSFISAIILLPFYYIVGLHRVRAIVSCVRKHPLTNVFPTERRCYGRHT